MSVEQQGGDETTNLAVSQLPKPPVDQDESMHTAISSLSSTIQPEEESEKDVLVTSFSDVIKETTDDKSQRGVVEWFLGLSADERSASLGFLDRAFLVTFLAMVTSTMQQPTGCEGEYRSCTECHTLFVSCVCEILFEPQFKFWQPHIEFEFEDTPRADGSTDGHFDWNAHIAIKDIESAFAKAMRNGTEAPKQQSVSSPVETANQEDSEAAKSVEAADASKQRLDSDVFRIRSLEKPSPSVLSLLENVCVVLPCAFTHASSTSPDRLVPFVTVNPEFLEKFNDEELVLALFPSGAEPIVGGSPVLSRDLMKHDVAATPPWLNRLVARQADCEMTTLSALLLERLKFQVSVAFRERGPSAWVDTGSGSSQYASTHEHDSRSAGLTTFAATPKSLIIDVRSSAISLRHINSSMDAEAVSCCLRPFLKTFFPATSHRSASLKLENLVFTPIQFLACKMNDGDFAAWDGAIEKSLKLVSSYDRFHGRVDGPAPSESATEVVLNAGVTFDKPSPMIVTPSIEDTPIDHPSSESTLTAPSSIVNHGHPGGKKKKKKNKKRKSRKLSIADEEGTPYEGFSVSLAKSVDAQKDQAPKKHNGATSVPTSAVPADVSAVEMSQEKLSRPRSVDSDDTDFSIVEDLASLKSLAPPPGISSSEPSVDFVLSRPSSDIADSPTASEAPAPVVHVGVIDIELMDADAQDDGEMWETVEVRARGTRKKSTAPSQYAASSSFNQHNGSLSSLADNGHAFKKNKPVRSPVTRKKSASRKVARDVILSLLDSVDEEVTRRQQLKRDHLLKHEQLKPQILRSPVRLATPSNPWKLGPPLVKGSLSAPQTVQPQPITQENVVAKKGASLRDVLLGRHMTVAPKLVHSPHAKHPVFRNASVSPVKSPSSRAKSHVVSCADQNTAPTYQETASSYSNVPTTTKSGPTSVEDRESKSDNSSVETDEALQNQARVPSGHASHISPPLPTMLSAENPNSANSSVASSLEVPHSSRRHHHISSVDVNDVGYHLLDVCDRLSQDMSLFMSRRALALNTRRRERGALLGALQSTVASLWPNRGYVEMYGSCATQLDLPSSDLDVVIIGLDRLTAENGSITDPPESISRSASLSAGDISRSQSVDDECVEGPEQEASNAQEQRSSRHLPLGAYPSLHLPKNADRVVRLAAALENQSWAVQIKSIPTASVPVIKILADPSKLTGTNSIGEWMNNHDHMAARVAVNNDATDMPHHVSMQNFQPLWRGADVMNGLLKLDVTFEGPEHGGIGSTQFSAQVVAEACQEAGLHPDATSLVQVVMVLKEILAQRKLNEPYSGGLSSYALLLLVVALLQERAVIREEIERAERQRQAMASGDSTASFNTPIQPIPHAWAPSSRTERSSLPPKASQSWAEHAKGKSSTSRNSGPSKTETTSDSKNPKKPSRRPEQPTKSTHPSSAASSQKSTGSSWASIAKLSSGAKDSQQSVKKSNGSVPESKISSQPSKPSFADAVARSTTAAKAATQRKEFRPQSSAASETGSSDSKGATKAVEASRLGLGDISTQNVESTVFSSSKDCGASTSSPSLTVDASIGAPSFYQQGYNDVIEVLCSGETTAGKLLMHFLLYYGQHFDAQSTAIDISGKHERDFGGNSSPYSYYSPFIMRRSAGIIDPVTGMLTVDPIVIYDPLEGAENNNVARRCFAWSSVRWVFAQSYSTLSSAVERSATPPATPGGIGKSGSTAETFPTDPHLPPHNLESTGDLMDPSSPLLRCLLSF